MRVLSDWNKIYKGSCPKCAGDFYIVDNSLYLINNQSSAIKRYKIRCLNCYKDMAVPMKVDIIHVCNCSEESKAFYQGYFNSKGKFLGFIFVANINSNLSDVKPNLKHGPFLRLNCLGGDGNADGFVFTGGNGNGTFFEYEKDPEDEDKIRNTEIEFKNGMKNGTYKFNYHNGSEVINFVDDIKNGLNEIFSKSRRISYYLYKDNKIISQGVDFEGVWKKESNYSNDHRNYQFELFKDHSESHKIGFGNVVNGRLYGHCQVLIQGSTSDGLSRFLEGYFNEDKCIERIRVIDEFGRTIDNAGDVTFYK